ncbi:DUF3306 domain-containing protein [Vibrio maerlii]|uniref:DUF3306 domain-containing protein n=1 Tax=Vibrio maerlii TaxID=2231648 RepID=UPI000E3C4033|nr:DUF3306 domain-containing protein [Vibrio maerlii]
MSSTSNGFLSRWSKRKLEEKETVTEEDALALNHQGSSEPVVESEVSYDLAESTEEVIIQSDNEQSTEEPIQAEDSKQTEGEESIASLLTSDADKSIKKAALRKLFLSEEFNQVDRLNDYDHDYSSVKPLASEVAETLRGWVKEQIEENEEDESVEANSAESIRDQTEDSEKAHSEQPPVDQAGNNIDEELTAEVEHSQQNDA